MTVPRYYEDIGQYRFRYIDDDDITHVADIAEIEETYDFDGTCFFNIRVIDIPEMRPKQDILHYATLVEMFFREHILHWANKRNHVLPIFHVRVTGFDFDFSAFPYPYNKQSDTFLYEAERVKRLFSEKPVSLVQGEPFAIWDFQVDDFINGTGDFAEKNDPEQWISRKDLDVESMRFRDWVDQHYQCKSEPEIRRWDSAKTKMDESRGVIIDYGDVVVGPISEGFAEELREGLKKILKR